MLIQPQVQRYAAESGLRDNLTADKRTLAADSFQREHAVWAQLREDVGRPA